MDHHVAQTRKMFRDCGLDISAMQWKRSPDALLALKRFNGVPDNFAEPVPWRYFPNAYLAKSWPKYYGRFLECQK